MQVISEKKIKIGILGGTFDPPHKGHIYISKIALKKLKLRKLIWAVTTKNPFKKKPFLSLPLRINYLKKFLTKKEKKIFIKCFDNKINSIKTYNLIKKFKKKNKNSKDIFYNWS